MCATIYQDHTTVRVTRALRSTTTAELAVVGMAACDTFYASASDTWRRLLCFHYTLCSKKVYPLMFDNNFGKCGPIFKILPSTE